MADKFSPAQRSNCMSKVRSANTKPEIKVRKHLFSKGFRFRINVKSLPGTPDIVLPKYRTCIFINGCFWHGHKGCKLYTVPETNTEFWVEKVARNQERDLVNNQRLESLSWNVITIWECELKKNVLDNTLAKVEAELAQNKLKWEQYQDRRRADREFRIMEAKRKKTIREELMHELQEKFNTPASVFKLSQSEADML